MNQENRLIKAAAIIIFIYIIIWLSSIFVPNNFGSYPKPEPYPYAGGPVISYPTQNVVTDPEYPVQTESDDRSEYDYEVLPPSNTIPTNPDMVVCTMEAKVCPDGSAVGRSGPNCEFAPCPSK